MCGFLLLILFSSIEKLSHTNLQDRCCVVDGYHLGRFTIDNGWLVSAGRGLWLLFVKEMNSADHTYVVPGMRNVSFS